MYAALHCVYSSSDGACSNTVHNFCMGYFLQNLNKYFKKTGENVILVGDFLKIPESIMP